MNVKLVLLIVAMILVVPSISTAENNKEYTIEMDLIDGDIFVYDLDISGVLNSYLQVPEWDVNEVINNAPDNTLTIESFGNSCINIVNDCLRLIRSYEINMTLIHDEDSDTFTDDTTLIYSYREVVENGIDMSWSEFTKSQETWMQIRGEDYYEEKIIVETVDTSTSQITPDKISVGDSWSLNTESDIVTITRVREDGGDWETETTEESWSNTTNFYAESSGNVFIGGESHDTVKISTQNIGENDLQYNYYNVNGVPIKAEYYDENGALMMILTLNEYDYSNEPTNQSSQILPGFGFIAAASMITAGILFPRKRIE